MPTADRRDFVPGAIACFLDQTYLRKELLVVDDGTDPVEDLIPDDLRIRYHRIEKRMEIADKRTLCVRLAQGDIICHWDDDDWYAPERIERQVRTLKQCNVGATGYNSALFYDVKSRAVWLYRGQPFYSVGASLCYTRSWHLRFRFSGRGIGEDNRIVFAAAAKRSLTSVPGHTMLVARIHPGNSSRKNTGGHCYTLLKPEALPEGFPR